jgi:hypothetical protein
MNRKLLVAAPVLAALLTPSFSGAQIAQSTFAADADGWLSVTLPYPSAIPPTIVASFAPTWNSDSGGYISMVDPDGTTTGNTEYWQAPAKYLGSKTAAYGGALEFDLANAPGSGLFSQEDIILLGGGLTLIHPLGGASPTAAFQHYSIPLTEAGWKRDNLAGPAATQLEFLAALANVTQIFIRAEYQLGMDTEYLDNVVMSGPVTAVGHLAAGFALEQNIPNPFNPATRIPLSVDRDSAIRVGVYDLKGSLVRSLWDGPITRGQHEIAWDGRDSGGRAVASGVYYCRARTSEATRVVRMVLLK